jgi:hypothetical protein
MYSCLTDGEGLSFARLAGLVALAKESGGEEEEGTREDDGAECEVLVTGDGEDAVVSEGADW